jgi:hypothetical protein
MRTKTDTKLTALQVYVMLSLANYLWSGKWKLIEIKSTVRKWRECMSIDRKGRDEVKNI